MKWLVPVWFLIEAKDRGEAWTRVHTGVDWGLLDDEAKAFGAEVLEGAADDVEDGEAECQEDSDG